MLALFFLKTLSPLVQLSGIRNRFNSANAAFEKINNLMEEESKDENLPENAAVTVKEGKIEIKNLDYEIEDKKLLDNVSLTIQPGESVGVIGPVGGGKSTL